MNFLSSFATTAARQTVNSTYLRPYGSMTQLDIDQQKKTIFAVLDLNGESQPLEIRIQHYEVVQRNGQSYLELGGVETSREWVNTLLREHLLDKVIRPKLREQPLPPMVGMLL